MATKRLILHDGQKPTDEQLEEVRQASERPVCFEELNKLCDGMYCELDQWFQRINDAYEAAEIKEVEASEIVDISRLILGHIVRMVPYEAAERLVSTLSGERFEFTEDREYRQARAEGIAEGAQMFAKLIKQIIPGSDEYYAALDATDEERMEMYRKYHIIENATHA